ncbi:MAG: orotidine-5'-phosphate decarboxylase [Candidatus Sungbacteria bacterium]|uniref:Orotidine 5'-phosphate decarboxylase n=1 Tax=Candidatus Sungiibacteriota bacterium TaxID=2750080 RepID=A0A932YVE4_9BACT|nr:orotidine-5'-phosphate decarboxylase [Candidatus Sungbacteria bacterium]
MNLAQARSCQIAALDFITSTVAEQMATILQPHVGMFKVGAMLFTAVGPAVIEYLRDTVGLPVFLDLKYHDTPETVAGASCAAAGLGVEMFTIHCAGGMPMMTAARKAVDEAMELPAIRANSRSRPKILGVTALTSQEALDLERESTIAVNEDASSRAIQELFDEIVMRRALLAEEAGLDGVVTSARYAAHVRKACRPSFLIVTPGIHRVETAGEAIRGGADYVVIGRLFRQTRDPIGIAGQLTWEIAAAAERKEA